MATRLQSIAFGVGENAAADIDSLSSTHVRFRQLSQDVPSLEYGTETDKDEIGKGNEFISQVFPTAYSFGHQLNKYSSAEFTAWAWCFGLGNVALATGLYTALPLDPGTKLELPFFSFVTQLAEGGGSAIDEAIKGCQVQEVMTTFKYGPTRASSETNCTILGSGRNVQPSAVTLPATQTEAGLTSQSMAITINGVDYVAGTSGVGRRCILEGAVGWQNNQLADLGYHPGAGLQDGAGVMGRMFFGNRVPIFRFSAFLEHNSTELAKLIAQTTGTASLKLQKDATHYCQWDFPSVSFSSVRRGQEQGLVKVDVEVAPKFDSISGTVLTFTSKNALTVIAQ